MDFLYMKEIIDQRIEYFKEKLFTGLPCRVISFNSDENTVNVQPVMYEHYPDGVSKTFPIIENVPVHFMGGGGAILTFPIKPNDPAWLMFSARDFDQWMQDGVVPSRSTTARKLAYNDCVALVGLRTKNTSPHASTEDVELRFELGGDKLGKIAIKSDKSIVIESGDSDLVITATSDGKLRVENGSDELIGILSDLIGTLSTTTVKTMYGLSPLESKLDLIDLKSRLDTFKG